MRYSLVLLLLLLPGIGGAQEPDGNTVLRNIDNNITAENMKVTSTMTIHGERVSRSITARSWIQGTKKSFSEYIAPPREQGTKMLKLEDELWMYSPQTDRIIRIAGHMLRQSMMGSDLSYEDMMEDPKLENMYTARVTGSDTLNGRQCWILELTAKKEDIAYYSRKMWVDKDRMIALKENRYAKSGKLLKTAEIKEVMHQDGRWYPKISVIKDALSRGNGTEYVIDKIEFNVKIPDYIFTKASLRR